MAGETGQLRDFIEDLGPGQVVGRQALGARCLGEIQLSLNQKKGYLEIEVIRAKDLKAKQGSKVIPGRSFRSHSPSRDGILDSYIYIEHPRPHTSKESYSLCLLFRSSLCEALRGER